MNSCYIFLTLQCFKILKQASTQDLKFLLISSVLAFISFKVGDRGITSQKLDHRSNSQGPLFPTELDRNLKSDTYVYISHVLNA